MLNETYGHNTFNFLQNLKAGMLISLTFMQAETCNKASQRDHMEIKQAIMTLVTTK